MVGNDPNPEGAYTRTTRAQCIVCKEDKLLMVQHHYKSETWWCLPGGTVEQGETLAQAALRELQEECCVSGVILQKTSHWMDLARYETVTFLVDIGDQTPRINAAAEFLGMDPFLTDVKWMTLAEIPERDRAFLWAAGLLGIETFSAEALKWGDDISYPRSCETNKSDPFVQDSVGRTTLFYAAERADLEQVRRIIFSLAGTDLCPQRLSLIEIKDSSGLTASDVAEQAGHKEIADLLRGEQMRMEFFE